MADLYETLSEYSNLNNLLSNGFKTFKFDDANIVTPIPNSLVNYVDAELKDLVADENKYQLKIYADAVQDNGLNADFVVIMDSCTIGGAAEGSLKTVNKIKEGQYLSGRTIAEGKSVNVTVVGSITVGGSPYYNFVYECYGVISNITYLPEFKDYAGASSLVHIAGANSKLIGITLINSATYAHTITTGGLIFE